MTGRSEVMKEYAARQRRRGRTQVKLWVPVDMVPWLHRMADDARRMSELGLDPLTRLPSALIERPGDD